MKNFRVTYYFDFYVEALNDDKARDSIDENLSDYFMWFDNKYEPECHVEEVK
jgi:hypothetical protein